MKLKMYLYENCFVTETDDVLSPIKILEIRFKGLELPASDVTISKEAFDKLSELPRTERKDEMGDETIQLAVKDGKFDYFVTTPYSVVSIVDKNGHTFTVEEGSDLSLMTVVDTIEPSEEFIEQFKNL